MGYNAEQKEEMRSERAKSERLLNAAMSRSKQGKGRIAIPVMAEIIASNLDDKEVGMLIEGLRNAKEI